MAKDTRARILETTARLLQHRGYHGTSLSDILSESGAPRGSLYFHFPGGKDQLVIEATRASVAETTREIREALARAPDPARGVRFIFEDSAAILAETEYTFGCPVAPVILDASGGVAELAEVCRQAFEEWIAIVEDTLVEADIQPDRARSLSLLVVSALEGLFLIARAYRDPAALQEVGEVLEAIIQQALPRLSVSGP
jgi:TetR/AcrR family transcriptional regulator, lmrAB and yxaGH operons repressor